MRPLALTALLLAGSIALTSCTDGLPLATPIESTQRSATRTATPPGLTLSNPAAIHTPVEHPYLTIMLVGMELPAGFPPVTPDLGSRFVAPQLSFFCQLPPDSNCPRIGSFELIDSHGTRLSASIAVTGEGFLSTESIPGGTTMTGGMVFMVPLDAAPIILRYVAQGREAFFRIE